MKESSETFCLSEIRLRKLVDEREKMIEQVRVLLGGIHPIVNFSLTSALVLR